MHPRPPAWSLLSRILFLSRSWAEYHFWADFEQNINIEQNLSRIFLLSRSWEKQYSLSRTSLSRCFEAISEYRTAKHQVCPTLNSNPKKKKERKWFIEQNVIEQMFWSRFRVSYSKTSSVSDLEFKPQKKERDGGWGKEKQLNEHNAIQPECTVQMKSVDTKKSGPKESPPAARYFVRARYAWTSSNSTTKVTAGFSRFTKGCNIFPMTHYFQSSNKPGCCFSIRRLAQNGISTPISHLKYPSN